jgi:[pyruvate, water dikinase]-phosphate phosphotransferase / [pyruvate, water dikinase] kinase
LTPHFDATGPLMGFLRNPDNEVHRMDADYQRRNDAMEFTIPHDDGLSLATIANAEIVIVCISRVSKSPKSLSLWGRGVIG